MSDNFDTPIPAGTQFASDDVTGVHYQRMKLSWGVPNAATDASATNPLPVAVPVSEGTLLASGARTTTQASADQTNAISKSLLVIVDITAASGTGGLTVAIQAKDPVSGNYVTLASNSSALVATGTKIIGVSPGGSTTGAGASVLAMASLPLPRTWRVSVAVGDASSYTYSLAYVLS